MEAISEGECLHCGPVDPGLLAAMAHVTYQPVRIIEQILQQQNLFPQQVKGIVKGRLYLKSVHFYAVSFCCFISFLYVCVQKQLHWSYKMQ